MDEAISPAKFARLALAHPKALRFVKDALKDKVIGEEKDRFCALYFEVLRQYYPLGRVC